jgi:hypothetical protein
LKWLYDIKIAINEIDGYFVEYPKDFLRYYSVSSLTVSSLFFGNNNMVFNIETITILPIKIASRVYRFLYISIYLIV